MVIRSVCRMRPPPGGPDDESLRMDVELRVTRPGGGQPRQPGVELLVGGLSRVGSGHQVGAADPLQVLGQAARGQLVADQAQRWAARVRKSSQVRHVDPPRRS